MVATTRDLLTLMVRVVMLAFLTGAVIQAVAVLVEQPASLGAHSPAASYVGCALALVSVALMLALALNASFLPDRLFAPERLGVFFAAVMATGAAAIVIGLAQSVRSGTVMAEVVLFGAVPFVIMGLVSPGLFRRPSRDGGGPGADDRPDGDGHDRSRQRRGGRGRR